MTIKPYFDDGTVTLYHGNNLEITDWLAADVLVTDTPYGRNWRQGRLKRSKSDGHSGIRGDGNATARNAVLDLWGTRPAVVFGDLMLPPATGTKITLVFRKPPNAGTRGAIGGFRRDAEAIYLIGPWSSGLGSHSSIIGTGSRSQGNPSSAQGRYGHPHAKPVDVMETLISACPPGVVADPFAGAGSTLIAARNLGRRAIGVELEERYCEAAARRLSQPVIEFPQVEAS